MAAGGVPSLLDVLRKHKAEGALEAALGLLAKLLALEEARSELVAQGEEGPPPGTSALVVWVYVLQSHLYWHVACGLPFFCSAWPHNAAGLKCVMI